MHSHRFTVPQQSTVGRTESVTYCSTNAGVWASLLDLQRPKMSTLGLFPLPCWPHGYCWLIIQGLRHTYTTDFLHTPTPPCPLTSSISSASHNDTGIISCSGEQICQNTVTFPTGKWHGNRSLWSQAGWVNTVTCAQHSQQSKGKTQNSVATEQEAQQEIYYSFI